MFIVASRSNFLEKSPKLTPYFLSSFFDDLFVVVEFVFHRISEHILEKCDIRRDLCGCSHTTPGQGTNLLDTNDIIHPPNRIPTQKRFTNHATQELQSTE